jgi:hypothetical protein
MGLTFIDGTVTGPTGTKAAVQFMPDPESFQPETPAHAHDAGIATKLLLMRGRGSVLECPERIRGFFSTSGGSEKRSYSGHVPNNRATCRRRSLTVAALI